MRSEGKAQARLALSASATADAFNVLPPARIWSASALPSAAFAFTKRLERLSSIGSEQQKP